MLCFTVNNCFLPLSSFACILETNFFFYQDGDKAKPENNPHFIQGSHVLLSKPPFSGVGFPSFHGICSYSPEQVTFFSSCLLHQLVARTWCCLMWLLLCMGTKEGHGFQFNADWPKIYLIGLLACDNLCFHPIYGLQHPTNLTWSCSSFISLFLAGFGRFVHSPSTFLCSL